MNLINQAEEKREKTTEEQVDLENNEQERTAEEKAEELKTNDHKQEVVAEEQKETEKVEPEQPKQPQTEEKQEQQSDQEAQPQTAQEKEPEADTQENTASMDDDIPEPPAQPAAESEKTVEKTDEEAVAEPKEEKHEKTTAKDAELAQYMETFKNYKQGDIIKGTIVGISESEVLVDISYKSEGSIPLSEFDGSETPEKNSEIWVYYERSENAEGKVLLSKRKADFHLAFDRMNEIYKNNEKVTGEVKKRVRGGMIVDILGIEAFLPGSQISSKPVPNLDHFINKEMTFKIINLDKEKKNVIVSRRKLMEEERKDKIEKLLGKIYIGAELDGEVKNITDYGAFIDLGGLDGLLHITDMTWGQINHPSEMLNISDKVKVKVIDYKPEEERISLGLKQLVPHPWENIEAKYEEGTKVTVKVSSLKPYGAFVELEPGVEGLVHISEMSWTRRITNPKQVLDVDDTIDAIILHASKEDKKISLGIKQMEPNPWLTIDERYPVGTVIKGKVRSLTPFGAFVEIEKDIDGLVHISDMSWTKRITNPKDFLSKGEEVEAVVISIDKHLHRIALSMKQLVADPWQKLDEMLPVNTEVTGVITNMISKGVLVQVDHEGLTVEGFVPISHLAIPRLERPDYAFSKGDELPMKVIELDMENRRLIFSVKAYLFSKEREVLQEFLAKYEPTPQKITQKKEEARRKNAEKNKAKSSKKSEKKPKKEHVQETEKKPQTDQNNKPESDNSETIKTEPLEKEEQQATAGESQVNNNEASEDRNDENSNTEESENQQREITEDEEKTLSIAAKEAEINSEVTIPEENIAVEDSEEKTVIEEPTNKEDI